MNSHPYQQTFGLRSCPFVGRLPVAAGYLTAAQQRVLHKLADRIESGGRLMTLVGPDQVGKTTLATALPVLLDLPVRTVVLSSAGDITAAGHWEKSTAQVGLWEHPYRCFTGLLHSVLRQLGGPACTGADELLLTRMIVDILQRMLQRGERLLLICRDAQNIEPEVLVRLRSWSRLVLKDLRGCPVEMVSVILIGEPILNTLLNLPAWRGIRDCLDARFALASMTFPAVRDYLHQLLRQAGAQMKVERAFSLGALWRLAAVSQGLPGLLHTLAHEAMIRAHRDGRARVVASDIAPGSLLPGTSPIPRMRWLTTVLPALLLLASALWWGAATGQSQSQDCPPGAVTTSRAEPAERVSATAAQALSASQQLESPVSPPPVRPAETGPAVDDLAWDVQDAMPEAQTAPAATAETGLALDAAIPAGDRHR